MIVDESIKTPFSANPLRSNFTRWPSKNDVNHGHAGVPINPSNIENAARITSGNVMTAALSREVVATMALAE
jgi:hypothetical protein